MPCVRIVGLVYGETVTKKRSTRTKDWRLDGESADGMVQSIPSAAHTAL